MARDEMSVAKVLNLWGTLSRFPGGKWLFSRLAGILAPYSNSIRADVEQLRPGYAQAVLRDRRSVRNHLRCVHAVALVNLGEFVSGIAMYASMPPNVRGIVVDIHATFLKKARGELFAQSYCALPDIDEPIDFPLYAQIKDSEGDVVSEVKVVWRLEKRG
jgi:hypothetical protein